MPGPREIAYDTYIAPLMTQIISMCREHKIPIVASFELDVQDGDEPDNPMMCTTALTAKEDVGDVRSKKLHQMVDVIHPRHPPIMMVTVTKEDGSKKITAILP